MNKKDEYRTKEYIELSKEMDKGIESMKKTLGIFKSQDILGKVEKLKRDSEVKNKIIQSLTKMTELHIDYYTKDKVTNEIYWSPSWNNYFIIKIMVGKTKQINEKWEDPKKFMKKLEKNGFQKNGEWSWNE